MKRLALLSLLTIAISAAQVQAAPELSIDKALKIANQYLKESGQTGNVAIVGINLENTSMTGGTTVWAVKWSAPIILSDTKRETGLEIAMDGSYARYTEKVANANSPATIGVPADRAALSNHRTRSERPSILDLKH